MFGPNVPLHVRAPDLLPAVHAADCIRGQQVVGLSDLRVFVRVKIRVLLKSIFSASIIGGRFVRSDALALGIVVGLPGVIAPDCIARGGGLVSGAVGVVNPAGVR